MALDNPLLKMTPENFEKYVCGVVRREKMALKDVSVTHLEFVKGMDGDYQMDLVATFVVLREALFRVLIECKRYSNPIKRETVMILQQKLQSTGSQKGMVFSTSSFQRGATKFAKAHGIALVQVHRGKKHVFVTNERGLALPETSEEEDLLDAWTAELVTHVGSHSCPYLARPDVYPGENLKVYFGL
jgi:hypothetical protein